MAMGLGSALYVHGPGLVNAGGKPVGRDFLAFWAASELALAGRATDAYDVATIQKVQSETIGAEVKPVAWFYPPTFFLAVLPLALLPYAAALVLWLAVPMAALAALLWAVAKRFVWLGLLFPGVAQSLISGQNGVLSACLLGGGLVAMERRPWLAGLMFGLLSYKPQIAVLLAPALLAGRHWRALIGAAVTVAALAAASLAAFGVEPWTAFAHNLAFVREVVETERLPLERFPTLLAAARLLGSSMPLGYVVQGIGALAAFGMVATLWRARAPLPVAGTAVALSLPLATPYAYDYDLSVLALPLAWLAATWQAPRSAEVALLAILWAMPVASWLVARATDVQLAPLAALAGLVMLWRHASRQLAIAGGNP